jgi:hypothetical protein
MYKFKSIFNNKRLKKAKGILAPLFYIIFDIVDFDGRKLLMKNSKINKIHSGERAFLICSGSSLNYIDISRLREEQTMCIGHMYLHNLITELDPKMFLLGETYKGIRYDQKKIKPKAQLFPEYKDKVYNVKYNRYLYDKTARDYLYCNNIDQSFPENSIIFAKAEDYPFIEKNGFYKNKQVIYAKYTGFNYRNDRLIEDFDLTRRTFTYNAGSVTSALIALIYMGFKEIYLLGAGYTSKPRLEFHFYDNFIFQKSLGYEVAYQKAFSLIETINKENKVDVKLFGLFEKGDYYHAQYVQEFKDDDNSNAHRQLNNMAQANGICIKNIVPQGFESPIYEKISWDEVVKHISK